MKVIVDTDVWSEALRRSAMRPSAEVNELRELILEDRVELLGPIRMEILCGIRENTRFEIFRKHISAFVDRSLTTEIYETAANFYNLCRRKGIQGSNNDFLICACSTLWELPILSKDKDYLLYKKHLPITFHQPRTS